MQSDMSRDAPIARIRKSAVSEVWVTVGEFEGKVACHIREYFHPADKPEWLPTKKGVSIPPDLIGPAVDAVDEMCGRNSVGEVAALARGKKVKLSFGIQEFNKHIYSEIRVYYGGTTENNDWKPGKGVTLPLAMLGQLAEALRIAEDKLDAD